MKLVVATIVLVVSVLVVSRLLTDRQNHRIELDELVRFRKDHPSACVGCRHFDGVGCRGDWLKCLGDDEPFKSYEPKVGSVRRNRWTSKR